MTETTTEVIKEPVSAQPETPIQQPQAQSPEVKKEEDPPEDPNWRAFREGRKKDRLDREAAERKASEKEAEVTALKAAMEAAFAKNPSPSPLYQQQYDPYQQHNEETEEQRIEKKVNAAIAKKEAEFERQRAERERIEYPQRLARQYQDFNQTISQENLDYLDYHYPEISRPLSRLQDDFEKWEDIYRAIKKHVPNANGAKRDAIKAAQNLDKPKSISSMGVSQIDNTGSPHILSEDRKAANWARMQRQLKGLS